MAYDRNFDSVESTQPSSSNTEDKHSHISDLSIEWKPITQLTPYKGNARTHSAKQIRQIADSIIAFGFTNPILIDEHNMIIAGHGRLLAAKSLDINKVPTVQLSHMSDAQKRAYILADNKIAANAGWDSDMLAIEFQSILEFEPDFDLALSGFEVAEIDIIIDDYGNQPDPLDEPVMVMTDREPATKLGDLWSLAGHRLVCGDCRESAVMDILMQASRAQMVFTDPPYNVHIQGNVCGSGSIKHPEFAMASGEMSKAEFTAFLRTTFDILITHSIDGSIHDICMDWRHIGELLGAAESAGYEYKNLCIWKKSNAGMGSLYRSQHELVAIFKSGNAKHINNIELGKYGRYRTNVWEYAGVNSFGDGQKDLTMHPTVKPCALVIDAIKDCSKRGGIILDPFGGSGTTLIAAEKTGRSARLVEIDPHYVDVTIERWQALTGLDAVLEATGQTYSEVKAERSSNEGGSNDR